MVQSLNGRSNGRSQLTGAERRADARRLEILRAASRTFRERGFAATGMRDIAAHADLSPGILYHYFKGKHELLYFCQDRSLDRMQAALEAARKSGEPATEQVRRVIVAHVLCLLDELEGSAAHLEVDALPAKLRARIVEKRDRYEQGIRKLLAAGVHAGELVECDPTLVARAILGALNWSARWFRPDGPSTPAEVADALARYLVRGLAAGAQTRRVSLKTPMPRGIA